MLWTRSRSKVPENYLNDLALTSADMEARKDLKLLHESNLHEISDQALKLLTATSIKNVSVDEVSAQLISQAKLLAGHQVYSDYNPKTFSSDRNLQFSQQIMLFLKSCFLEGKNVRSTSSAPEVVSIMSKVAKVDCARLQKEFNSQLESYEAAAEKDPKAYGAVYASIKKFTEDLRSIDVTKQASKHEVYETWSAFSRFRQTYGLDLWRSKPKDYDSAISDLNKMSELVAEMSAAVNYANAYEDKKDAYALSYVKVHGAKTLLENAVQARPNDNELRNAYVVLNSQINCTEMYGYGPSLPQHEAPTTSPK